MVPVKVSLKDTVGFSKVWTYNGVSMIINDTAIQFATDYANLVLANFIRQCQLEAEQQARAAAAPKIITEV